MADPRQSLVARWLAAGDAGDLEAFDDLLHPGAVIAHLRDGKVIEAWEIADIAALHDQVGS